MENSHCKGKTKYDVEDLVRIGDSIHNSFASFIVVANGDTETDEGKVSIHTACHGNESDVIQMMYKVLAENELLRNIIIQALVKVRFDRVRKESDLYQDEDDD